MEPNIVVAFGLLVARAVLEFLEAQNLPRATTHTFVNTFKTLHVCEHLFSVCNTNSDNVLGSGRLARCVFFNRGHGASTLGRAGPVESLPRANEDVSLSCRRTLLAGRWDSSFPPSIRYEGRSGQGVSGRSSQVPLKRGHLCLNRCRPFVAAEARKFRLKALVVQQRCQKYMPMAFHTILPYRMYNPERCWLACRQ